MRIIIVEGVDRIGKSTLIRHLSDIIPDSIIARGMNTTNMLKNIDDVRRRPDFFETRHIGLLEQVRDQFYTMTHYPEKFGNQCWLFDRLHWTAYCYAKVLRPDTLAKVFKFDEGLIKYNQLFEAELTQMLVKSFSSVQMLTFVLPENVLPEHDDFVKDREKSRLINNEFRNSFKHSVIIDKHLIELSYDENTRFTNMRELFPTIEKLVL